MPILQSLGTTTELDAVNTVLVSSGETPLPSNTVLENQTGFDVLTALDLLKKITIEVQTEPWKFNTEDGRRHNPFESDWVWVDNDGSEVLINLYLDPGLYYTAWSLTPCPENRDLDVFVKPSEVYTDVGGDPVNVLYDKQYHRDGPVADRYPAVYLDVQYVHDFAVLPEVAKRYISVVASRRYCQQALGSAEKGTFSREDEQAALRLLKREQGRPRKYNFKNNPEIAQGLGRNPGRPTFGRKLFNK